MNYIKIKHFDIANGEGVRLSLFVSGCKFHCEDCFNDESWDFNCGKNFDETTLKYFDKELSNNQYDGLSILGGDPLWQDKKGILQLIKLVEIAKSYNKNVWIWSGFTWEEINNIPDIKLDLIKRCDVFVDGRFKKELKNLSLKWRGSSNQRVIDIQKTLLANQVIIKEGV